MQLKARPEDFVVREHIANLSFADGQHSVYLLRKINWNTEDCLQWLASKLNVPRKNMGYCGNKDKHALTEQFITIKQGPKQVYTPDEWSLTYVGQRDEQLHLGTHDRNFFIITVKEYEAAIPPYHPVKNLFGEQRFGDNTVVGFALLKKDYRGACELLKMECGTDPIGALRKIPRHTLLLYVHAAQSFLWNELALSLPDVQDEVPLPGFATEGKYEKQVDALLEKFSLTKESFIDRSFQELTLEGGSRKLLQEIKDFSAGKIDSTTVRLCFSLGKGEYATETIRQLL